MRVPVALAVLLVAALPPALANHVPFLTAELVGVDGTTALIRFVAVGGGGVLDIETGDGRWLAISDGWQRTVSGLWPYPEGRGIVYLSDGAPVEWVRSHGDDSVVTELSFDYLGDGAHDLLFRGCCTHEGYQYGSLMVTIAGVGALPPPRAPDAPGWYQASPQNSYGAVSIGFGASPYDGGARITTYRVYRVVDGATEAIVDERDGRLANHNFFRDASVPEGAEIAYRLSAENALGETFSEARTVTTWVRPGPVRDLVAVPGNEPLETIVSWAPPEEPGSPPVARYVVEVSHDGENWSFHVATTATTVTHRDEPFQHLTTTPVSHLFRVRASAGPTTTVCGNAGPATPLALPCPLA